MRIIFVAGSVRRARDGLLVNWQIGFQFFAADFAIRAPQLSFMVSFSLLMCWRNVLRLRHL